MIHGQKLGLVIPGGAIFALASLPVFAPESLDQSTTRLRHAFVSSFFSLKIPSIRYPVAGTSWQVNCLYLLLLLLSFLLRPLESRSRLCLGDRERFGLQDVSLK